jgi:hypothetical protein
MLVESIPQIEKRNAASTHMKNAGRAATPKKWEVKSE